MKEDELKNKFKEWQIDEKLIPLFVHLVSKSILTAAKNQPYPEDLENDAFTLAKLAQELPQRKSLRIIIEEITLLVLAQVEANDIPSIGINHYRLLIRLILTHPFKEGKGIIEAKEAEIRRVCDSVIEDLRRKGRIVVESGALNLTESGSKYNEHLLQSFDAVPYHKLLDELTDRIDFWLVALQEFESEIEEFLDKDTSISGECLTRFLPDSGESLYSKLEPKVWDMVTEYRQKIRPQELPNPPKLPRGQLGSAARIESDVKSVALYSARMGRGITRLAFTRHETDALMWAKGKLTEANYECKTDPFTNLHAYDRREGTCRILVGTHLDSVLNGGEYDGVVGLVAFLESLRLASEENRSFPLPVDVVIFRAEESTVFKQALLGSKVATGKFNAKDLQNIRVDRDQELKENLALYYPDYSLGDLKPITLFDVLSHYNDAYPSEINP